MPTPIAMSSTLIRPSSQPAGWMMLNRISRVTVNAACPAANEISAGATPAISTATGSNAQSTVMSVPMPIRITAPITKPTTVPRMARTAFCPVDKRVGA